MSVPILELVEWCERERARSTALFERLGGWVASTSNPGLQQLFATAAHRHAWHAELWADRCPAIPVVATASGGAAIADAAGDIDRWSAYATALGLLLVDLEALHDRIDPGLDPGTARVLDLVLVDAQHLAHELTTAQP